tara:strand:+ start:108 stop:215 length:108 start_codon:yes stop_codon:yes gene_type:complete
MIDQNRLNLCQSILYWMPIDLDGLVNGMRTGDMQY